MRKYVLAAVVAAGCLSLTACGQTVAPDSIKVENTQNKVITVESNEKVQVTPDIAEIVFSVYTQAENPEDCQTKNNLDVDKVIQTLDNLGVDEKQIQTSVYGLNPIYDWKSGTQKITQYEMSTTVTVRDIPMEQVGALLSECVDSGVNNIRTVSYLSSQYDANYQEALKKAVASAKVKAEAIAEAGNCTVGNIVKVDETGSNRDIGYTGYLNDSREIAVAGAGSSVMPGQLDVEARVSVQFELISK